MSTWDDDTPTPAPSPERAVGELRLIQYDGFDRRLVIDHADRRVWICAEHVDTGRWCVDNLPPNMQEVSCVDDVFTIRGSNRTVVYQLREYDHPTDRYLAEWPD